MHLTGVGNFGIPLIRELDRRGIVNTYDDNKAWITSGADQLILLEYASDDKFYLILRTISGGTDNTMGC